MDKQNTIKTNVKRMNVKGLKKNNSRVFRPYIKSTDVELTPIFINTDIERSFAQHAKSKVDNKNRLCKKIIY